MLFYPFIIPFPNGLPLPTGMFGTPTKSKRESFPSIHGRGRKIPSAHQRLANLLETMINMNPTELRLIREQTGEIVVVARGLVVVVVYVHADRIHAM